MKCKYLKYDLFRQTALNTNPGRKGDKKEIFDKLWALFLCIPRDPLKSAFRVELPEELFKSISDNIEKLMSYAKSTMDYDLQQTANDLFCCLAEGESGEIIVPVERLSEMLKTLNNNYEFKTPQFSKKTIGKMKSAIAQIESFLRFAGDKKQITVKAAQLAVLEKLAERKPLEIHRSSYW